MLCVEIETMRFARARAMMLSENGPVNISGKSVKISKWTECPFESADFIIELFIDSVSEFSLIYW